jgi:trimeric autotransporter adhesin
MSNIIYKGALVGTQVDFQTGNLTDISTFDTDVRSSAIQNSITNGVTDRGASQDAIHTMSGVLASLSNHPDITPASNIAIDSSSGTVLQDASFTFDSDGHVTAASFDSINLDTIYSTIEDVNSISGVLRTDIATNVSNISTNATNIATNATNIATNVTNIATNVTNIATNAADIDSLSGLIDTVEAYDLDDVCGNGATTTRDIQVEDIRVNGGNITGPATITIDPDAAGASGKVIIAGDLQVDGTTTTINSTSVQIDDLSLVLGTGAPNAAAADGGGIIIDGTGAANIAEFTFDGTNNRWKTNSIDIAADIVGNLAGNASTASKWSAETTITLGGDLGGSVTFDGSDTTETLNATIANGAVEGKMLAVDSVSGVHIDSDQIDSEHYAALSIDNEHIANSTIQNGKLVNDSVSITGGAGLAGGGDAVLGGSAVSLSISAGHGLTAGTDALDINLDGTTLSKGASGIKVNSIGTDQIAADSITEYHLASTIAGDNITFTNGVLSVADGDIRAAVFPSTAVLDANKALVSDSNGKVSVASNISSTELSHLNSVSSNIQTQLNAKADDSTEMSAGNGLTGGGTLAGDRVFSTTADQGHLDEIELGSDNTSVSNIVTKGGILILRGTDNNGITTSGSDGNAVALNDKTTVAFEGVVQSARMDQDSDNGSYVAMWKIQGVIRRDSDSTNMLSSFVTKTFAGSHASSYGLSVSVSGNGLKINSDQTSTNLTTSATINYNWIEDTSA